MPGPVDIEALLRHREFVRRLARRLVRDDARADDVVQETGGREALREAWSWLLDG